MFEDMSFPFKLKDGDYIGEDNLYYCGKCHTKKQCIVNWFGEDRPMPCSCRCEEERLRKEKREAEKQKFERRVRELRSICMTDGELKEWTFYHDDGENEKISAAMRKYADNFEDMKKKNVGLLLYGPVGTGKTFYAACIANQLIEQGVPVMMTNFTSLAEKLFAKNVDIIGKLQKYPLLIIDDLGAERGSDYMLEQVFRVIDERYRSGKPMIITTNLTANEIINPSDLKYKRIYDRILERCHLIKVDGKSRRTAEIAERNGNMKEYFGI